MSIVLPYQLESFSPGNMVFYRLLQQCHEMILDYLIGFDIALRYK